MPGVGLTQLKFRKVLFEMPALKPYWGKPTVRNFRGGDGNVGIIRSPISAFSLPANPYSNWKVTRIKDGIQRLIWRER
jgi:hypothetical protein